MFKIAVIMMFAGLFSLGCQSGPKTIIVGHRGASKIAPENTVASTKLAFVKKADISEIDVYLSQDNRIMVIHDKTTKRTAGGNIDLKIVETDSQKLRELEVGSFKSEAYTGEKIPFIEEIIEVIPSGKKLFIEIKCGKEIAPYLAEAITQSGKQDQMVLISGNIEAMVETRKILPYLPTYWVKATKKDKETSEYPLYDDSVIEEALANNLTGLDLFYKPLTKEFVQKAQAAGLEVYVWTVNEIEDAQKMIEFGVDGITTDVPGVLRDELKL